LAVGAFGTRRVGIVALHRTRRAALAGGRTGTAFARTIDSRNGDAPLARAILFHRAGKGVGLVRRYLENRFRIEDADRADGGLGHITRLAQHGQQPARLGLVLAPQAHLEPGAALEALAGTRVAVAGLFGGEAGADILGRRTR